MLYVLTLCIKTIGLIQIRIDTHVNVNQLESHDQDQWNFLLRSQKKSNFVFLIERKIYSAAASLSVAPSRVEMAAKMA